MSTYAILGQRMDALEAGFDEALAVAHAARHRPRCLCIENSTDPPEMYVARLGSTYVIKRMPFTGGLHATSCPSYEPPDGWSGNGQVMGSAIQEDPVSGVTTLKLDFALSRSGPRTIEAGDYQHGGSAASDGSRLTLRGLLHYLWDEAELTHWKPGFAGRRSWGSVRGHLLRAACGKAVRGLPLAARLYVPEPFSVDQRDVLNARRRAHWQRASETTTGSVRPLMLLVGELKEILPARFGCKAVVKHVPDQGFVMDDGLASRLARRFAHELSWWGATDDLHMAVAATFSLGGAGVPTIEEMTLMPTTRQWLPVEHELGRVLVDELVHRGRSLRTPLRYNMPPDRELAVAVLTDVAEHPVALHVHAGAYPEHGADTEPDEDQPPDSAWHWWSGDPMPPLPLAAPLAMA